MTDRHSVFQMTAPEKGERLDRMLAQASDLSRSRLKILILEGAVTVGQRTIRDPGHRVNAGDAVSVTIPPDAPAEAMEEARVTARAGVPLESLLHTYRVGHAVVWFHPELLRRCR